MRQEAVNTAAEWRGQTPSNAPGLRLVLSEAGPDVA